MRNWTVKLLTNRQYFTIISAGNPDLQTLLQRVSCTHEGSNEILDKPWCNIRDIKHSGSTAIITHHLHRMHCESLLTYQPIIEAIIEGLGRCIDPWIKGSCSKGIQTRTFAGEDRKTQMEPPPQLSQDGTNYLLDSQEQDYVTLKRSRWPTWLLRALTVTHNSTLLGISKFF